MKDICCVFLCREQKSIAAHNINHLQKMIDDSKYDCDLFIYDNVIFNSDSKMMTFYKINEIKDRIEQRENSVTKSNALKILSYIFICLLFLVIGLYLGRKFCILRRKRYAMELDDNDYVYESNSNNYKDDKKLIQL